MEPKSNTSPHAGAPWRSILYVPVDNARFVAAAHTRGADAIALDLEDGVAPDRRAQARAQLPAAIAALAAHGAPVLVRINRSWLEAVDDLAAAVRPGLRALVLPKVEDAGRVRALDQIAGECEARAGLPAGTVAFVLLIEGPAALPRLPALAAASRRTLALSLGPEDYARAAGCALDDDALLGPNLQVAQAAAAAGLWPLGFVGSIADYRDPDALRARLERARRLGFRGAFFIHPAQVAVANEAYAPDESERAWAQRVLQAAQAAGGGAFALDGQMIDAPVIERARELLGRG